MDEIARYANEAFPNEACGFVLLGGEIINCTNAAPEPAHAFIIDPLEAAWWWETGKVVAVWHTHPTTSAVPSREDEEQAVPGLGFWIYSVLDEDLGVYHMDEGGRLRLLRLESPA